MKLLEALKNYKEPIIKASQWLALAALLTILYLYVWNWIVSPKLNSFLFGSEELGLWKGFVVILFINISSYTKPTNKGV